MNVNDASWLVLLAALLAGCSKTEPAQPAAVPQPVVNVPPPPAPPPPPAAPVVAQQLPPAGPIAPQGVLRKAEKGVGAKGRGYGQGIIATPIASYFAMRERIAFDIQIPEAMKLFKAIEGRAARVERRVHGEDHQGQPYQPAAVARGRAIPVRPEDRATDGLTAGERIRYATETRRTRRGRVRETHRRRPLWCVSRTLQ